MPGKDRSLNETNRFQKLPFEKPQINLVRSTAGRMWLVSLCAFLAVIQSSLSDSFASLFVALAAVIAAVLTEFIFCYKNGRMGILKDGSAVASALILALLLPNHIHPVYAFLGAAFAMAVVKHSFGGLGSNWVNPAVGGWLLIRFSWPAAFADALEGSPLSSLSESLSRGLSNPQGSPLGLLKIDGIAGSGADSVVRSFLNNTIFSLTGAELPSGYIELFASPANGIIADRGLLGLLLGTIIVTAAQANRAWIPAVYLGCYGLLVRVFGAIPYGGNLAGGDILFGFFSGGVMAAAFLFAADPATGAKTIPGMAAAAFLSGLFAYLFRYPGAEPYGALFAAALVNALLPLIRGMESRRYLKKRRIP